MFWINNMVTYDCQLIWELLFILLTLSLLVCILTPTDQC